MDTQRARTDDLPLAPEDDDPHQSDVEAEGPPRTHFFCHDCKVVVPITFEAAAEIAKHVGHKCEYTRII